MVKNRKPSRWTKKILIAIILLTAVIAVLLLVEYYSELIGLVYKKPHLYVIEDRCGTMLDQLIHTIKDEGYCRESCRNECLTRKEEFSSSEFIEKENACHICNCYCK